MMDHLAAYSLEGRMAVITGAASGIGREAAILFAHAGATVVISDINEAGLKNTADAIGPRAHPVTADLSDPGTAEALAAAAEAVAPIHIWANVAGLGATARITDVTQAMFDRITSTNMAGVFWSCAAAARRMQPRGRGSIINISSNAADQAIPALSVYAMTKAAVNMLTRSLAAELGPDGIRVNAIAPGFILTEMTAPASLSPEAREKLITGNAARSPLRTVGEPEDIAQAMLYLASDASRFVTGQILRVNGGVAMP